jgi:predicted ATPase
MLKRISIRGYKSIEDLTVELAPLSVMFGPNASGKSNFLDALQILSRIAASRTLQEAFQPPYRGTPLESFTFPREGIAGLLQKDSASFSIEIDLRLSQHVIDSVDKQIRAMRGTSPEERMQASRSSNGNSERNGSTSQMSYIRERELRYRIEVEIVPRSGMLRVRDEHLVALSTVGEPSRKRKPFLELVDNQFHLRMEGQAHPKYHDRFLDHSILSFPLYTPHYPHMAAVRQELASWFFFYFEPRERMRAPNSVKEVRHIGMMGEDLAAFLNTLRALDHKQFEAVEKSLPMMIPGVTKIDVSPNDLGEVELRLFERDTPIPARLLSEGTLRVLGLLALGGAKEPPSLLGFEEPENGIHPRRIRLVAELLKNRATGDAQVILTTHSPILLDLLPCNCLHVCRKVRGRTRIDSFQTWGPMGKKLKLDDISTDLDEEEISSVSDRLLRGDFDD